MISAEEYAVPVRYSLTQRQLYWGLTRMQVVLVVSLGLFFVMGLYMWYVAPVPVILMLIFRSMNKNDAYALDVWIKDFMGPSRIDP